MVYTDDNTTSPSPQTALRFVYPERVAGKVLQGMKNIEGNDANLIVDGAWHEMEIK